VLNTQTSFTSQIKSSVIGDARTVLVESKEKGISGGAIAKKVKNMVGEGDYAIQWKIAFENTE
tara:strand:- start:196 stop:384 length:189 start_codon:yes stop_codon:yes gene_type:complete